MTLDSIRRDAGKEMGIAVFGPSLDDCGNSIGGQKVPEYLSGTLDLHVF